MNKRNLSLFLVFIMVFSFSNISLASFQDSNKDVTKIDALRIDAKNIKVDTSIAMQKEIKDNKTIINFKVANSVNKNELYADSKGVGENHAPVADLRYLILNPDSLTSDGYLTTDTQVAWLWSYNGTNFTYDPDGDTITNIEVGGIPSSCITSYATDENNNIIGFIVKIPVSGTYTMTFKCQDEHGLYSNTWSTSFYIATPVSNIPTVTWSKIFGENQSGHGECTKATTDGGLIIGGTMSNYGYVVKADSIGNKIWDKTINCFIVRGICQTPDGGFLIVGEKTKGSYLARLDSLGNTLWEKDINSDLKRLNSIEATSDGNFVLSGDIYSSSNREDFYLAKVDVNGNVLFEKSYGGVYEEFSYKAIQVSDGGFVIIGATFSFKQGIDISDVYLVRTDKYGNVLWNKRYGGSGTDSGTDLKQTKDGGFIFVGQNDYKPFIVKIDYYGNTVMQKVLDTKGAFDSIQLTSTGEYFVTGEKTYDTNFHCNLYIAKIDEQMNTKWDYEMIQGDLFSYGFDISKTYDGGYIVTGYQQTNANGPRQIVAVKVAQ